MGWRRFFKRRFWDDERAREIEAHIQIETDENLARGMSPAEARAAALRRFGNPLLVREAIRDSNSLAALDGVWQDLRHAVRLLAKNPGFATVAILSLALGIGANTAIFSVLDALVLRTLPVLEPQRLVEIVVSGGKGTAFSNPRWEGLRDHLPPQLTGSFAWSLRRFNLETAGEARYAEGLLASGDYFDTLGVRAVLGRVFTAADDTRGGGPAGAVAVISYGFWQKNYAGDARVLGRTLSLDGHAFEIIGVTPRGFFGADVGHSFDVAIPLFAEAILRPEYTSLDNPNNHWLSVIARLRDATTLEQAKSGVDTVARAILDAPEDQPSFEVRPAAKGLSALRARYGESVRLLLGVVGLVLLIACANLANLLLARAAAREREFGVRIAIGAGRARLLRQLLTESVLLAALGGGLGVLFALWGSRVLVQFLQTSNTRVTLDIGLDPRMLAFTAAISCLTAVLFGLVPAFRASGVAPNAALKQGDRAASHAPARLRLGKLLVVSQVALSLVLLFGAGLFLRTLRNLTRLDAGFQTDDVLLVRLDVGRGSRPAEQRAALYRDVLERLRALPGVRAASRAELTPISGWLMESGVYVPGYTPRTRRDGNVLTNRVSDQYFKSLATPLLSGRDFDTRDTPGSPGVAIINEAFARRFAGNPVGQSFSEGPDRSYEVIAVVKDAKYEELRDPIQPTAYFAMSQRSLAGTSTGLQVRSSLPLASLVPSVRETILAADSNVSLSIKTFATQVNDSLVQERLIAALLGFFALLAVALVLIGLHGLIAYGVARRRSEIGIRIALGADRPWVVWLVLRDVVLMTTSGTLLGLLAALAAGRVVESMLYGLSPDDPLTMAGAALLLIALGSLAGYLPARRAASLAPLQALREE